MTRRVRVRRLSRAEQHVLTAKVKDLSLSARVHQRYRLIEEVRRGWTPLEAAERVGCLFTVAYAWLRRFNASGFTTFEQVPNPKERPPVLRASQLRDLVEVALFNPRERGLPFSAWSVPKLAAYCRQEGLVPPVTDEWVRRLLHREGLTPQRIRTWKTSHDPAFDRKKNAVRALYRRCPPRAAGAPHQPLSRLLTIRDIKLECH